VSEYLDEWSAFPESPHDDQVDATTQFLAHSTQKEEVLVV